MNAETPYITPDGQTAWVIATDEASKNLANLLQLYRAGKAEPLIFGDAGQPEAVVIPWNVFTRYAALAADEDGFDHVYDIARQRLADNQPSIPIEDIADEIGWDLNEKIDDSEFRKPQ